MQLRNTDWQAVGGALRDYPLWVVAAAVGVALLSYLTYCSFDLLGRYYTGHRLPIRQVIPLVFVCYAFNLNLNALVGGVALRFRLYSRLGLDIPTIARVFSLSIITNWLGYLWLAGCVFAMGWVKLPAGWAVGNGGLRVIGVAMIIAAVIYVLACAFSRKRSWQIRGQTIELPSWQLALVQAAVGALNWSLMALIIWLLLPPEAFYPGVLGVLLISSIAGVITHIPAGLGVLEMIFLTLLQDELPRSSLLAALIGYRAVYFLLPLSVAVAIYLVLEKRAKAMRSANRQAA
ncbi:hypothetical protein DHB74_08600 [Pseudomonas sp. G11-1]|uniref:UPF0104 family protein n=2 Tax=Pseudomonadaceae TaxID=135621 RepID=A0A4U0YU83_9GAMM|nr:hypothetical protein [Pseudomonas sp. G11-1]MCO5789632.1 hypothetical protein [Pseudomonas sp. G11-2]TKA92603.1 UPF0104 family protein [Halopseudomonas bauzanensis]